MQWFAYLLWGAVALCIGAIFYSYIYFRYFMPQEVETVEENSAAHGEGFPFEEQRWQLLLDCTPFSVDELPLSTTQQRIDWAYQLFGVEPEWFRGGDVAMYPCLSFHNNVGASIDFIHQRMEENPQLRLYVVKPKNIELSESVYDASVVLCFAAPVVYAGKAAWRYWPVNVYWEWGYEPEQMQCRQIIYVAQQSGCEIVGVELDVADMYFLLESKLIPQPLYSISPDPTLDAPVGQWDAVALANAGETVLGQCESALSAATLQEKIQQAGWHIN